jgi:hypothetical protein
MRGRGVCIEVLIGLDCGGCLSEVERGLSCICVGVAIRLDTWVSGLVFLEYGVFGCMSGFCRV